MIPQVYHKFIQTILEKTEEGEVTWESATHFAFRLKSKRSIIEVGQSHEPGDKPNAYYFVFINRTKKIEAGFEVQDPEEGFTTMEKLYTVALASATHIKVELSNFLDEL